MVAGLLIILPVQPIMSRRHVNYFGLVLRWDSEEQKPRLDGWFRGKNSIVGIAYVSGDMARGRSTILYGKLSLRGSCLVPVALHVLVCIVDVGSNR